MTWGYPFGGGGGAAVDETDHPWQKYTGLTLSNNSNPDGYLTGVTESIPGRYTIDLDYSSAARTRASEGAQWILGGVSPDSGIDLLDEWWNKADPGMWRLQVRIKVIQWPDDLTPNHWIMASIMGDASKATPGAGGLTNSGYLRDVDGSLEIGSFGTWGNPTFVPGTQPRATANELIFENAFKAAAAQSGAYARCLANQNGVAALGYLFANTFWTIAAIDPSTNVHVLSLGHYSAGAGSSTTPMIIEIEGRVIPIDPDYVA